MTEGVHMAHTGAAGLDPGLAQSQGLRHAFAIDRAFQK
jgi:hypothetical protein